MPRSTTREVGVTMVKPWAGGGTLARSLPQRQSASMPETSSSFGGAFQQHAGPAGEFDGGHAGIRV